MIGFQVWKGESTRGCWDIFLCQKARIHSKTNGNISTGQLEGASLKAQKRPISEILSKPDAQQANRKKVNRDNCEVRGLDFKNQLYNGCDSRSCGKNKTEKARLFQS